MLKLAEFSSGFHLLPKNGWILKTAARARYGLKTTGLGSDRNKAENGKDGKEKKAFTLFKFGPDTEQRCQPSAEEIGGQRITIG